MPFTAEAVDGQQGLLRALAEAEHTLVEIAPGVWRHSAEGVTYVPKGGPVAETFADPVRTEKPAQGA